MFVQQQPLAIRDAAGDGHGWILKLKGCTPPSFDWASRRLGPTPTFNTKPKNPRQRSLVASGFSETFYGVVIGVCASNCLGPFRDRRLRRRLDFTEVEPGDVSTETSL